MSEVLTPIHELPPIDPERDRRAIAQIGDAATRLINRHTNPARFKEDPEFSDLNAVITSYMGDEPRWTAAEVTPWSLAENFRTDFLNDFPENAFPEVVKDVFIVGYVTEELLPEYHLVIDKRLGSVSEPLWFWTRIWTFEEGEHSKGVEGIIIVNKMIHPKELAMIRRNALLRGRTPQPNTSIETLAYTKDQEKATLVTHNNAGILLTQGYGTDSSVVKLVEDGTKLIDIDEETLRNLDRDEKAAYGRQTGRATQKRISGDEARHHLVKEGLFLEVQKIDPSLAICAYERKLREFQMPGAGIDNFMRRAARIAMAGVYDPILHLEEVVKPSLEKMDITNLEGLDSEGEKARERIMIHVQQLEEKAKEFKAKRDEHRANVIASGNPKKEIWVPEKIKKKVTS